MLSEMGRNTCPISSEYALGWRLLTDSSPTRVLATLLAGIGFGLAIWARRELGKNWSAIVSIREGHELIMSGPYRFIRHPIYSGILLAVAGTGLLVGEVRALLGILLIVAAIASKARKDELWL